MSYNSEEKKFKLGMWSGFIGGSMLTITGIVGIVDFRAFLQVAIVFLVPYFLTLSWGIIAIIGAILLYYNHDIGDYFLLVSGSLAVFGMFCPLLVFEFESEVIIIYFSYHFGYVDPFIVLIGGIIDILVKKEMILS